MVQIEFSIGGKELAKVLTYYGFIGSTSEDKIVCPFHDDVNPSMIVDYETGSYFCFGCGCSGDAYSFVKGMNPKLNDLWAMNKLVRILKSKKTREVKLTRFKKSKKTDKQALIEAEDYFYGLAKVDWLHKSDNSLVYEEVKKVSEYMMNRGFKRSTLKHCDCRITYNRSYAMVFPLLDNGEFKGWVSRTTEPAIEKKRKYLYNEGFSRSNTLCGNYGRDKYTYLVEGYMDMLKFKQFGVKDVAAVLGWKISDEQIKKLKDKGVTTVISALDNDKCGIQGTEYLKKYFNVIRFRYLKGIKDPGEMTKELFDKMNGKTLRSVNLRKPKGNSVQGQGISKCKR